MHPAAATVALFVGLFTGTIEALSRYRDEPFKAVLTTLYGWIYILLNAALGLAAYALLLWRPGSVPDDPGSHMKLALAAGLGAAAVVRARLFSIKVGDKEVAVGPGFLVDRFLGLLDRQIDRARALERTRLVVREMAGVDFARAAQYARTVILGSRQSLPIGERTELTEKLREIENRRDDAEQKVHALGFVVLDFMGEEFFRHLITQVRTREAAVEPTAAAGVRPGSQSELVRAGLDRVAFAEAERRFHVVAAEDEALSLEERQDLLQELRQIANRDIPELDKSRAVGFLVLDFFGSQVFEKHFPP